MQATVGLGQEGLVSRYQYGDLGKSSEPFEGAPSNAILLSPSFLGAELFMWAMGAQSPSGHDFFTLNPSAIEKAVPIVGTAYRKKQAGT